MARQTISIIGAGLGGLTLGRCLQKRGIAAILYERLDSPPRYSYGITLHASAYTPLLKALDVDETDFKSRVAVDASSGGLGKIGNAATRGENSFRANRGKLEEWLREGLNLEWNLGLHLGPQQIERPSKSSEQSTLCLDNGKRVQSDIIIGADGPHSALRSSLLPESQLTILPYVVYNGKSRMDHAEFEEKIRPHMQDSNIINYKHGDARINLSINEYQSSGKVSISWTYSRRSRGTSDPLHKPERALSGAKTIPDELYREIHDLHQVGLPEPFATVFGADMVQRGPILHWLMRTIIVPKENLQDLARDGIVLMGDAAHAQPIVGGNGANEALSDAVSLAEELAKGGQKDLAGWIDSRYSTWEESVGAAQQNIEALHASNSERL